MSGLGFGDYAFGDDDDQDEEEFSWAVSAPKDGIIFLIDASPAMFIKDGDESQFDLCIKAVHNVMRNKIISSNKDFLGVVFYATEKHKNPNESKHVYILQDLEQPGPDQILQLEKVLEDGKEGFDKEYGHSGDYLLRDVFWTCSKMFSDCSQKLGFQRILLFTNNDNPHSDNPQHQAQAKKRAEDFYNNKIELELFPMKKEGVRFDVSVFYKDCLFEGEDEIVDIPNPTEKFEELMTRVRAKDHKKRASGHIPLILGKDLELGVGVYNLVRPTTKASTVKLYKKNNSEVKSVTKTYLDETAEILMDHDLKKAAIYDGRKICFEKDELNQIKTFGSRGLDLMGFKPKSSLKKYHYIAPAQFIYPDENSIKGSTTLFSALLQKCLDREVIAICRYMPRKKTPPRFVALVPQREEQEDGVQVTPPGFHVIFLPFADDFRKLKYEETPRANSDQIDKAKKIIDKLKFNFSSENFENPALQKHYANLEALALDRDAPEEIEDYTMPNNEAMKRKAGTALQEFKDAVFPQGYGEGKAAKKAAGGGAKRAKAGDGVVDVEKEANEGRLEKLTVPILKEYVKAQKIKNAGTKKGDLVNAIKDHLGL